MNANEENVKMTSEVVRHVAKLSRLALTDEEIEQNASAFPHPESR